MGTRVPMPHRYGLRSASSFIGRSLHDPNSVETRNGEIEGISDVDRNADCIHDSYRNSLQSLHGVGVDEEQSALESDGRPSTPSYSILTVDDVLPIESVRARFLQIIVDHFVKENVVEVTGSSDANYGHWHDKHKRKLHEVCYEGDPRFVLPLMYVANLYETLVNDVNIRLSSLAGIREKTIGVALEAAGGLYRKLAKKFPRKGPCSFRRRELATSLQTRTMFPELVKQEENRVRFVVVNGLMIIEKPESMPPKDAEWFKRLTGRHEVSISGRDYKFYSPRHKYRRIQSQSISNISLGAFSATDSSCPLTNVEGFRPVNEPTGPAKFCDQCGAPYLRETSKFCTECGVSFQLSVDICGSDPSRNAVFARPPVVAPVTITQEAVPFAKEVGYNPSTLVYRRRSVQRDSVSDQGAVSLVEVGGSSFPSVDIRRQEFARMVLISATLRKNPKRSARRKVSYKCFI